MGRVLSLDLGTRYTGVAVSDETKTIAQGLETIRHFNEEELIQAVAELVQKYEVDTIVLGLPLSLSGRPSARSEEVRQFAIKLYAKLKLPMEFVDERYTTTAAAEVLAEAQGQKRRGFPLCQRPRSRGRTQKNKLAANCVSATLILESYLGRRGIRDSQKSLPSSTQT